MALKPQSESLSSSRALRLVGRFYRWVAWLGIAASVFFAGLVFVDQWRNMSRYNFVTTFELLKNSIFASGLVFTIGLFLCGMAFLVSLLIEAGLKMLENSYTQVDLMRRLVRQQSDVHSTTRLGENTTAQTHLPEQAIAEQPMRRMKS